jgi:DNA-binding MarR family transcriptional regulator
VVVTLLGEGKEIIERVFPEFNKHEAMFTDRLDATEVHEMARLLRVVTATASDAPLVAGDDTPR